MVPKHLIICLDHLKLMEILETKICNLLFSIIKNFGFM
jgi:hypothetical protein